MTWYNYLSITHHIIALLLSIIVFLNIKKYKGAFFTLFKIINIIFISIHLKYIPAVFRWANAPTPTQAVTEYMYNPKEVYEILRKYNITDLRFLKGYQMYQDAVTELQNLTEAVGFEYDLPFIWTENETAFVSILFSITILIYHSTGYMLIVLYKNLKGQGYSDIEIKTGVMIRKKGSLLD